MPFFSWLRHMARQLGWWRCVPGPAASSCRVAPRHRLSLETLEAREVPYNGTFGPEGWEAGLLNMINRMRTDPQAELQYFLTSFSPLASGDPHIQAALDQYGVNGTALLDQWSRLTPVAPLAWSAALSLAATRHNLQMIAHDQQSHQLPGEAPLSQRVEEAGYLNWDILGENVFAYGMSLMHIHAAFAIDWGPGPDGIQDPPEHRNNLMDPRFKDIGIGVTPENDPNTQVGQWVVTQNFGTLKDVNYSYILGNVYIDQNDNGRHDMGEGLTGVTVTLTDGTSPPWSTPTDANGYYQFNVQPGQYTLVFSGWPLTEPIVKHVVVGDENVLVNLRISGSFGTGNGNHAPQLPLGHAPHLPSVLEDMHSPQGGMVSALLAGAFHDADPDAQQGIAVYNVTGGDHGAWQYSLNQGQTWLDLEDVSLSAARLLRDTDWLRFVPDADFSGDVSLGFRAWDRTAGAFGGTAAVHEVGGWTAFSLEAGLATLTVVGVNDAPMLDVAAVPGLPPTASRSGTPAGSSVAFMLGQAATDADADAQYGIAVTGFSGGVPGYWQFSLDAGQTWSNFGGVNARKARLLRTEDWVRFVPRASVTGNVALHFRAWDRTAGIAGSVADLSFAGSSGGSSAFSRHQGQAGLRVNNAPSLRTGTMPVLTTVLEDDANPAGDFVASFATPLVRDGDPNQPRGIAVTGLTGTEDGTWQFSLDRGRSWTDFGDIATERAILLRGRDKVRFVPNADYFGTVTLCFRAWDRTAGTPAMAVNLGGVGAVGGGTAFSTDCTEAILAIAPVNDAPLLDEHGQPTLTPVAMNATDPQGDQVGKLLDLLVHDPDPGDEQGIAIIGLTGTANGKWQYSLNDGRTWITINNLSSSRALLLRDTDRIRFVPNRNFTGQASLMFRAWDRTAGTFGGSSDLSLVGAVGGITAFSATTQSGSVDVG